ncbi:MAG: CdaR family protein [Bacteroidales bacterium]|nr:CdaR family protein [Bacteroidales bacterium]
MNNEPSIIPEGIKPFKTKFGFYIFLVCLFFSTLLWLVIKFSKDYEIRQEVHISFVHVPEGKFITQADTVIHYSIKANGFKLLTENTHKQHRLQLDVSNYPSYTNSPLRQVVKINTKDLSPQIIAQYRHIEALYDMSLDEILIVMEAANSKKIPVRHSFTYSLEKPNYLYGDVKISPDSVVVYGGKQIIEQISEVYTIDTVLGTLSESRSFSLPLKFNDLNGCYLSHNQVNIHIPIEKYTEKELTVPIQTTEFQDNRHLKLFPEKVQVIFLTALNDYNDISPSMFEVVVDTSNINNATLLPVIVRSMPPRIIFTRSVPESVEFIIVQ